MNVTLEKLITFINFSDEEVVLFLHSCYYRLEATKTTIENFFTIRTHAPEIFSKRDPFANDVQETFKTMLVNSIILSPISTKYQFLYSIDNRMCVLMYMTHV